MNSNRISAIISSARFIFALMLAAAGVAHADDGFFKAAAMCEQVIGWDPGVWVYPANWPIATRTCYLEAPAAVNAYAAQFTPTKVDSAGPAIQPPRVICLLAVRWPQGKPQNAAGVVSASMGPRVNDGTPVPLECQQESYFAANATWQWWTTFMGQYLLSMPSSGQRPPVNAMLE